MTRTERNWAEGCLLADVKTAVRAARRLGYSQARFAALATIAFSSSSPSVSSVKSVDKVGCAACGLCPPWNKKHSASDRIPHSAFRTPQ